MGVVFGLLIERISIVLERRNVVLSIARKPSWFRFPGFTAKKGRELWTHACGRCLSALVCAALWCSQGSSLNAMSAGFSGMFIPVVLESSISSEVLYRVSCVGDSITKCDIETGKTDGYPREGEGFPNRLPALLGPEYDVLDFGVNGACALGIGHGTNPYENAQEYQWAQQHRPHYVILMLGTNDSSQLNWQENAFFEEDLGRIITAFLNTVPQPPLTSPKVILCSPIPVLFPNVGIQPDVVENEIIPRIHLLLQDYSTVVGLDCFTPFLDQNGVPQEAYYERPEDPDYPQGDGIHPNNAGDDLLSGLIHAAMFAPLDKTPPSTPPAPQATVLSPTSIRLTWNPSNGSPTGYHVLRDDVVIGIVKTGIFDDPNLPSQGSYRYRVRAFDGSMNLSGMSEETLVNTNQLPVLSLIGNKTVRVGETIQFTVSASDGDDSEHTLEYSAVAP